MENNRYVCNLLIQDGIYYDAKEEACKFKTFGNINIFVNGVRDLTKAL